MHSTTFVWLTLLICCWATPGLACIDVCWAERTAVKRGCPLDKPACDARLREFDAACREMCTASPRLPTAVQIRDYGLLLARERWGRLHEIETQSFTAIDGTPNTMVIILSTDPALTRDAVLREIRGGRPPSEWADTLRGIELGTTLAMPPVVGFWTGLSYEHAVVGAMEEELRRRYRGQSLTLEARLGWSLFPIFRYRVGKRTVHVEPHAGRFIEGALPRMPAVDPNAADLRARRARFSGHWLRVNARGASK